MPNMRNLGVDSIRPDELSEDRTEHVMPQRPLRRVLAFAGRTIDDVINDPISRNLVRGYYKLHRQVERSCEVTELEKQWNRL